MKRPTLLRHLQTILNEYPDDAQKFKLKFRFRTSHDFKYIVAVEVVIVW
jgi:hypothetical protein